MKISYSTYELEPIEHLVGILASTKGVLLRFEDTESVSYSLYHPIEKVGDLSIKEFLNKCRNYLIRPNFDRIQKFALSKERVGGLTRHKLKAYYSCPNLNFLFKNQLDIQMQDFKTVKIKISSLSELEPYLDFISEISMKFILDFNSRTHIEDFEDLDDGVRLFLENQVVYLEDPFKEYGPLQDIKIAADFEDYQDQEDFIISKPSGFNHNIKKASPDKLVVTSYLDHPLGQLLCGLWALENNVENECGVLSHGYYKLNKYSDLFAKSAFLDLKVFDEMVPLLENEKWTEI